MQWLLRHALQNVSSIGKLFFQRWKVKFPALEIYFSSVGNFIFQGWKVFLENVSQRDVCGSLKMVDLSFAKTEGGSKHFAHLVEIV